jgi:hypothetical protein
VFEAADRYFSCRLSILVRLALNKLMTSRMVLKANERKIDVSNAGFIVNSNRKTSIAN